MACGQPEWPQVTSLSDRVDGGRQLNIRPIAQQLCDVPAEWHDRILYKTAKGDLRYSEARARMLAVAAWLQQEHSLAAGHRVAVCLPKTLETLCLLYGVLAAGACFAPLQFNGPPDRLHRQLASIEPHLLLTTSRMKRKLEAEAGAPRLPPTVCIEMTDEGRGLADLVRGITPLPRPAPVDPKALAALYFTSGSTGEPKGIMVSYGGMAGTVAALAAGDAVSGNDRMISLIPLQYAASLQIFCPLIGGCSLRLVTDEEAMFPDRIATILQQERVSVWITAATALRLLVESEPLKGTRLDAMRLVIFFGERLPVPALRAAMQVMPNAVFENAYGASEAFRIMLYRASRPLPEGLDMIPLGRPTETYDLTLRNAEGQPVPDGEVGEICVVGDTVMMGYWKKPELTEASRIQGAAQSYRTGDLARLGDDGNYHLVGRADYRIKLRGHRFDLGEVEAALKAHPAVRDAVAIVLEAGPFKERVFAAVLAEKDDKLGAALKSLCAKRLPVFARPARIMLLNRFPQLPSGKIDRKALQTLGARPIAPKA
jgi:amino acid adenylation domain-containing protein